MSGEKQGHLSSKYLEAQLAGFELEAGLKEKIQTALDVLFIVQKAGTSEQADKQAAQEGEMAGKMVEQIARELSVLRNCKKIGGEWEAKAGGALEKLGILVDNVAEFERIRQRLLKKKENREGQAAAVLAGEENGLESLWNELDGSGNPEWFHAHKDEIEERFLGPAEPQTPEEPKGNAKTETVETTKSERIIEKWVEIIRNYLAEYDIKDEEIETTARRALGLLFDKINRARPGVAQEQFKKELKDLLTSVQELLKSIQGVKIEEKVKKLQGKEKVEYMQGRVAHFSEQLKGVLEAVLSRNGVFS